ncbi:MAG: metalloregulator ArsR/SmtB family transcription factor [Oscillospiraceae bacterium]
MTNYALIFKALGDANRLKIVQMLSYNELCACKLLERFKITQPTLSHHMNILCKSELVNVRKQGKWSYYSLNYKVVSNLKVFINNLENNKGGDL